MALSLTFGQFDGFKIWDSLQKNLGTVGAVVVTGILAIGAGAAIFAAVKLGGLLGVGALLLGGLGLLTKTGLLQIGFLLSLPALYNAFVQGVQQLWTFNWNSTDKELLASMESRLTAISGQFGEFVGSAMGYLLCGALPGVLAFAWNPAVAAVILSNVSAEASEEAYDNFAAIATSSRQLLWSNMIKHGFINTRRWLKRPDNPFYDLLKEKLGDNFTKWGESGQESFSFSNEVEERIEAISDPKLQNFAEEFVDSFSDACIDAGRIVVNTIHSQMAASRLMQRTVESPVQVISLEFERSADPTPVT